MRLLLRSALFPAKAITMFALACLCNSFTQFFALANVSLKKQQCSPQTKIIQLTLRCNLDRSLAIEVTPKRRLRCNHVFSLFPLYLRPRSFTERSCTFPANLLTSLSSKPLLSLSPLSKFIILMIDPRMGPKRTCQIVINGCAVTFSERKLVKTACLSCSLLWVLS